MRDALVAASLKQRGRSDHMYRQVMNSCLVQNAFVAPTVIKRGGMSGQYNGYEPGQKNTLLRSQSSL